jgi:hypothetical protein
MGKQLTKSQIIASYKSLKNMSVRDVARIAKSHDFDMRDRDVVELAVEADEKHGIGFKVVRDGLSWNLSSAADRLDWDLRSLSRDMYVEAATHDEFCRNAY